MKKQFLLFDEPKNFHLIFLAGKPIGAMSLLEYCIKSLLDDPKHMDYAECHGGQAKVVHRNFSAAWREKLAIQKELMTMVAKGLCPYKPVWMKQRDHWKKFLKALYAGESLMTNLGM